MVLRLPSECVEEIISNLLDKKPSRNTTAYTFNKDLHSCTLVSRHWCKISTPFLYAYPFHHFRHSSYSNFSYFKLIRTLLSCIPKSEIEQIILENSSIIQKLLYYLFCHYLDKNNNNNISATFNYISFIRGLVFDERLFTLSQLTFYQKAWFPSYIPKYMLGIFSSELPAIIMNHLLSFLCKHCNNLTVLEFPFTIQNNELFNDMIESLTFKSNGLKELHYVNTSKEEEEEDSLLRKDLYLSLSNNIYGLNLLCIDQNNLIENADSLSQFISLQKRLQQVILSRNGVMFDGYIQNERHYYDVVFKSLSTQSGCLQKLKFIKLNFNSLTLSDEAIDSLCSLKSIRELELNRCGCTSSKLDSWAKELTNLEVFEFKNSYAISDNFLIQVFQSSSHTLTKLVLEYKRDQFRDSKLLKEIPLHLHSLTHLELSRVYPIELIPIFKSCKRLVYLGAMLGLLNDMDIENFKNLGKFIPNSLKSIRFKDGRHLRLTRELLRSFLEECINSGGKLKYLEFNGDDSIGMDHFDVAEQFNVKLITKSMSLSFVKY